MWIRVDHQQNKERIWCIQIRKWWESYIIKYRYRYVYWKYYVARKWEEQIKRGIWQSWWWILAKVNVKTVWIRVDHQQNKERIRCIQIRKWWESYIIKYRYRYVYWKYYVARKWEEQIKRGIWQSWWWFLAQVNGLFGWYILGSRR